MLDDVFPERFCFDKLMSDICFTVAHNIANVGQYWPTLFHFYAEACVVKDWGRFSLAIFKTKDKLSLFVQKKN